MNWWVRILVVAAQAGLAAAAFRSGNSALGILLVVGAVLLLVSGRLARVDKSSPNSMARSAWGVSAVGVGFIGWSVLLAVGAIPGWKPAAVGGVIAGAGFVDIGRRIRRALPERHVPGS